MKKIITVLLILCLAPAICAISACAPKKSEAHTNYDLFAIYDDENCTLTGTVGVDYYNSTENELTDLKFNLYGNAYRQGSAFPPVSQAYQSRAYYAGTNYGGMEITNVEGGSGWNVAGEDENVLIVNLAEPVYPEQRVQVKIGYTLQLAKINHRTGVTRDTVNLGNFYPVLCAYTTDGFIECPYYTCGDPFVSEVADYNVEIDIPEAYTAAASGKQVSESVAEGRRKTKFSLERARDFALVLSKNFKILTEETDGVKVSYYYTSDANADKSLAAACQSLAYFNKTFGNYCYPTLSVVQTGFCYGGMEYPALTMIAEGQSEADNAYTIVHENAHQWWYAMVGNNQLTCGWQDEGLAEYSTLMFFENHPAYGYTRTGIVGSATRSYRAFFSVYNQLNGSVDTTMTRNLGAFSSEFEYTNVTYNKGLIMFDTLRETIGDEKFTSCLKNYFKNCSGKIASAEDLIAAFAACGTDVEGLFASFIEGKILI